MHTHFPMENISGLEETVMAYGLRKQKIREKTWKKAEAKNNKTYEHLHA